MRYFCTFLLASLSALLLTACGGGGASSASDPAPTPGASTPATSNVLKTAYAQHFLVGAAVRPDQLAEGSASAQLIATQFNVLVAENAMKPDALSLGDPSVLGEEAAYDFSNADRIVDFALAHGQKVRGHTLVWHSQQAGWMFRDHPDKALMLVRMKRYIRDVVGHFRGRVYAWDVVNEAFVGAGDDAAQIQGWRNSNWFQAFGGTPEGGIEWLAEAFRAAHAADPDALLFYNDYATEDPTKRALILAMIDALKAQGVPIHGIGHQSHYRLDYPSSWDGLERSIAAIGAKGLSNQVTELDISLYRASDLGALSKPFPAERLNVQAQRYGSLFQMLGRQRAVVSAALVWGLRDADSWLNTYPVTRVDGPLLFDDALLPKSALQAVLEAAR